LRIVSIYAVADLVPQAADVHVDDVRLRVDDVRLRIEGVPPDRREELLARADLSLLPHQVLEQQKLASRQVDPLALGENRATLEIEREGSVL
jgi:hypothetical protein